MSRRRRLAAWVPLLGVVTLAAPPAVAAHAIGGTFQLPVPRELYFAAAATAVAASFVVAVLILRPAGPVPAYPVLPLPAAASRIVSVLLAAIGLAWWAWAIWAAFVIGGITSVPGVLFWIVLWVGLPIVAITLGNPWPSFSPFRTIYRLLQSGAALIGVRSLDLCLPYPVGLRRWPAVALLFAAVWAELVLPASSAAGTVGVLLAGYTVLTVAGMLLFGPIAWLRNAELFEVLLGWFGRIGPVGRRTLDPAVCDGCAEDCDPLRCIDCPECAVVAEAGERRAELRPWFAGLTEIHRPGWSDTAFIILALAGVTFDGLHETTVWSGFLQMVNEPLGRLLGTANAHLAAGTLGLLLTWALFVGAFSLAAWLTRMTSTHAHWQTFDALAAAYAATLLPIAGGYLIAHYLTLFIQGIVWVPELAVDPNASVAPLLDAIPIAFVWYLSVGAIVVGHIAGILLAHRLALRDVPRARFLAALPLVALMIGYTVLSLWIIAQPITLNPG